MCSRVKVQNSLRFPFSVPESFDHTEVVRLGPGEEGQVRSVNYPLPYPANLNFTVQLQVSGVVQAQGNA